MSKKSDNLRNKKLAKKAPPPSDSEESEYETYSSSSETEDSDSTYVPPPRKKKGSKKVKSESESGSDSEDNDFEEYDEEADYNQAEFQKMMANIFPSKYTKEKAKKAAESKKAKKAAESKKAKKAAESKKAKKGPWRKSKKVESESESESDEDEDEDEDDESEDADDEDEEWDEDDEEEYDENMSGSGKNFNIIFTIGGNGDEEDFFEEDEKEKEDSEECDSEDEKTFMKETYTMPPEQPPKEDAKEDVKEDSKKDKKKKGSKEDKKKSKEKEEKAEDPKQEDIETEYQELVDLRKHLMEKLQKRPTNKILKNAIKECQDSIKELVRKTRNKNAKSYMKLIHGDKSKPNEMDYFKKKLSNKEQLKIMADLKEINKHMHTDKPYRLALLESNIPAKYKANVMQKLNTLKSMDPGDPEYYKIKTWVDTFMRVPFGVYKHLTVNMTDGIDACHDYMKNAKRILDDCAYGLNDAKMQILQMVGQWVANPSAMGTAIAIKGPMGTGKTTLVKDGISKILGREFAFITLGGAGDSSFLEGHSYTYEGSSWGKIVQILIDSKCMNPVIYFDELDKISDTPRGEEIIGILTHLTDTSQNNQFHDKYFSEIDFDVSKCLFIFSYNDESKVNSILKDRMYRIQTKGYETKDKVVIARNFLLPKIREQVSFAEGEIVIPDDTLNYIITNESFTKKESGVRNLKRCLEIIHTKLNLFRLVKSDDNLFASDMEIDVTFPITVTRKHVDVLIKSDEPMNQSLLAMYV